MNDINPSKHSITNNGSNIIYKCYGDCCQGKNKEHAIHPILALIIIIIVIIVTHTI